MEDPNVWIHACEQQSTLLWCVMPMAMKIWQLPNTKIHCIMPQYVEVVIGFGFEGLNEEIMFTFNKQHRLLWMWLQDVLFYVCKRFYF
jgi:hypothetical protein